ncbi:hypothetical protein ONS95_003180 [Cadophora gregata]|uniref:uncharacterized protein n=1 Tax=Cadophora gregata TaxID=51156 RepID=UPI0026DAB36F|nr:uncharacterized protein ONS95_003180 [Cadophora gregata]KAK0108369.1 hypothetical protein ONS95_003180 [Cadophora gregata]KAK0109039.1 hypothetical protein ONS96_002872 [Cadophora gregata f. sp. sojae]
MLQVYLDPCTVNSRKVLAGLDLMGVEYKLNHINYFTGEHKSPDYLKINPNGTVPSASDGPGFNITESNAILQYAADLHGSIYYPKDLKARADVNRWLLWEASVWFPSCYVYLVEYVVKPLLKTEPDQSIIDAQAPKWNQLASVLDAQLAKTKFLAGNEVTIADIAVAAPMHLHKAQRLPLDEHPNLKRWLVDIEKLPSWQKTQGAVDTALLPSVGNVNTNPNEVRANFNYTKDVDKLTEIYFYETEAGKDTHEPGDDPHEMVVTDGWERNRATPFATDKNGFSIHPFETQYQKWEDEANVREEFYPEIVDFVKKTTGARRVLVFDHTIRTKANAAKPITQETDTTKRAPVMLVHCDYTAESGPLRVEQLLGAEAKDLLSHRVAFFNVWKPLGTVEERPLAMCDVTSAPEEDFFKLHLRYRDRNGENYVMRYSPKHKWWYFPKMEADQVILLKTYDSRSDIARFVGHTAFEDPTSPPDAKTRESVEIRTIAFF